MYLFKILADLLRATLMNRISEYSIDPHKKFLKTNPPYIFFLAKTLEPYMKMPILLPHPLLPKLIARMFRVNQLRFKFLQSNYTTYPNTYNIDLA